MVESLPSILKVVGSIPGTCLACVITNTIENKIIKVKYIKKEKRKMHLAESQMVWLTMRITLHTPWYRLDAVLKSTLGPYQWGPGILFVCFPVWCFLIHCGKTTETGVQCSKFHALWSMQHGFSEVPTG